MAPPWTPFEGLAFGMAGLAASRDAGEKSTVALGKDLKAGLMVNYQRAEAVAKSEFGLSWEAARLKSLPATFKEMGQKRIEVLNDKNAWVKFKSMESQGQVHGEPRTTAYGLLRAVVHQGWRQATLWDAGCRVQGAYPGGGVEGGVRGEGEGCAAYCQHGPARHHLRCP